MGGFSQIFKDATGQLSNVRAASFASLFYAFFLNTYALVKDVSVDFEVFAGFLSAAFAPKVYRRFAEKQRVGSRQATEAQNAT